MKKRQDRVIGLHPWVRPVIRLFCAGTAGALMLTLPINWAQMGHAVALVAASVQQPANAAALLQERLTWASAANASAVSAAVAVSASAAAGTEDPRAGAGDTTAVSVLSTDVTAVTVQAASIPPPGEDGTGGKIYTQKLDSGDKRVNGIAVRNRSGKSLDVAGALSDPLPAQWEDTDQPQVLIIHTHTTEGYMLYDAGYYNAADRKRTEDHSRSVCAVGDAVVQTLAQEGIAAIHDTTVHDSPQYTGAYGRSEKTVTENLKKYPSVKVVLDLHRDAIMQGSTGLTKPTVTVAGQKAAQMMIIVGVVSTESLPHPQWQKNFALATQWQRALGKVDPDLMRPLSVTASRYNQHLSPGYLLVEVGSEGNTVQEAVYSGQLLGKTLAELLRSG